MVAPAELGADHRRSADCRGRAHARAFGAFSASGLRRKSRPLPRTCRHHAPTARLGVIRGDSASPIGLIALQGGRPEKRTPRPSRSQPGSKPLPTSPRLERSFHLASGCLRSEKINATWRLMPAGRFASCSAQSSIGSRGLQAELRGRACHGPITSTWNVDAPFCPKLAHRTIRTRQTLRLASRCFVWSPPLGTGHHPRLNNPTQFRLTWTITAAGRSRLCSRRGAHIRPGPP